MSQGKIVAEYDDFSIWETPLSPTVTVYLAPEHKDRTQIKPYDTDDLRTLQPGTYHMAYSWHVRVSTYEQALLEPEWEVFI